jgi:hypothetical protein
MRGFVARPDSRTGPRNVVRGWFSDRTAWAGRPTPPRRFIRAGTSGAAVLIVGALAGLVWANVAGP